MKILVLFIFISGFLPGCSNFDLFKNMSDGLPDVEMDTVEMYHDSVLMIGRVTDEGATYVELCGFCYNITGNPSMEENQVLLNGISGEFGVLIGDMLPETRYYIKSFAYSSTGYTLSETVIFDVGVAGPPEVPCTLPENIITIEDIDMEVVSAVGGATYSYTGDYGIDIICNDISLKKLELDFNSKPENGIYTTCSPYNLAGNENLVYAEAKIGLYGTAVNPGSLIYVTDLGNNTFEVAFCQIWVTFYSENMELKGRSVVIWEEI